MARIASRNFTKHCFLATWIFDIRNLDYFEPAGQTVDNLRGENHGFILDTGTFEDIRDLLKSVFIPALPRIQERGRSLKGQMIPSMRIPTCEAKRNLTGQQPRFYWSLIHPRMARSVSVMPTRIS